MKGISSSVNSRRSSGDRPAKPECPAKKIWPSGDSPVSKCFSDLHQMKRCPSMRAKIGSQLQLLLFEDSDAVFLSLIFRIPCHRAFQRLSRRDFLFDIAWKWICDEDVSTCLITFRKRYAMVFKESYVFLSLSFAQTTSFPEISSAQIFVGR